VRTWFERHIQTFVGSLGRLWSKPFSTLLTILVIGIALALPACLHVLVQNVRSASGGWGNALDISVYMKPKATLEQAKQVAERIRKRRDVEKVTLVKADDALEEFRRSSGFGEALDALKENPLPNALVVRPAAEARESSRVAELSEELRKIDGVDIVQLDTAWVSRFNAILDVVRRVVLLALGLFALGVLVIMQFVARPLKIALCTWGSSLTWRERALLAWIAPRGIVAAAVAALFAMRLQEQTFVDAELLVPLTFMIIIGTVVLQSSTARLIATWLGVAEPEPRGFLIVGAGPVARAIAKALKKRGYDSLLCDNNWNNVRAARMDGLNTFYGNAVSEYADRRLDLVGIGRLLGLSPQRELNALAAHRYRREFGDNNTFTLLTDTADDSKRSVSPPAGSIAFGKDVSYAGLESLLSQDAEIRETKLSESFDFDAYYKKYYKKAIPLFALDPKKRLRVFSAEHALSPGPGWTLLSLIQKDVEPRVEEQTDAAAGNAAAAQPASS